MRRGAIVFASLAALGVALLLLVGAGRETKLAFTLGVFPGGPVATLGSGQTGCQAPIDVPEGGAFDAITVPLGTYRRPGSPVAATVTDVTTGRVLARGTLPGGYPDVGERQLERIAVAPTVPEQSRIIVCLRNSGSGRVAIYGNPDIAAPASMLLKDGTPVGADAALRFETRSRSVLSLFGRSADRASLFKAGWVGPWAFWLLAALVVLAVPALITFALVRAERDCPDR